MRRRSGLSSGPSLFTPAVLALTGVCLVSVTLVTYMQWRRMQQVADAHLQVLQDFVAGASSKALRDSAECLIQEKARSVAREVDIYLAAHPGRSARQLQADPAFRRIATQRFGREGYTALVDLTADTCRLHVDPTAVDRDLSMPPSQLARLGEIARSAGAGREASCYCRWRDAAGDARDRYMSIAPVRNTTRDGAKLAVMAATSADSLLAPAADLRGRMREAFRTALNTMAERNAVIARRGLILLLMVSIAIASVLTYLSMRVAAESRALRVSETRFKALYETARDAIFVLDAETGAVLHVNAAAGDLLRRKPSELIAIHYTRLHPHERREYYRSKFGQQLKAGASAGFEGEALRSDGTAVPVLISGSVLELDGRRVLQNRFVDVSERKRAEDIARVQRDLAIALAVVDTLDKALLLILGAAVDIAAMDCGAIYLVDRASGELALACHRGLPGELVRRVTCFGPDSPNTRLVLAGKPFYGTVQDLPERVDDGGRLAALHAIAALPVRHEGRVIACLTVASHTARHVPPVARDALETISSQIGSVLARLEAERQREQAMAELEVLNRQLKLARREAERANRLKSEFVANTSHEIRTPLNGIIGYLQLILNGLYDSENELRACAAGAMDSARHLLRLINDVLDVAKIEAGKLALERTPVHVPSLLADLQSLTRVPAEQRGIELVFAPVADEPRPWADAERLKQVLVNLIGNAVKFTPGGGRITLRVIPQEAQGLVRFELEDTGVGIPRDKQEAIFEKFTQADGGTTRSKGGTGLGLTISRRLVEMMGGAMGVQSEGEGRGSCFHFTVPVYRGQARAEPSSPAVYLADLEVEGDPDAPLALVVEDDPVFRGCLCELLQNTGFSTVWAATADDAAVIADRYVPAVITIDYGLPASEGAALNTGWDLLNELQARGKLAHTAFVVISGDDRVVRQKLSFAQPPGPVMCLNKLSVARELPARLAEIRGDAA